MSFESQSFIATTCTTVIPVLVRSNETVIISPPPPPPSPEGDMLVSIQSLLLSAVCDDELRDIAVVFWNSVLPSTLQERAEAVFSEW